jgi:hypothetical protein
MDLWSMGNPIPELTFTPLQADFNFRKMNKNLGSAVYFCNILQSGGESTEKEEEDLLVILSVGPKYKDNLDGYSFSPAVNFYPYTCTVHASLLCRPEIVQLKEEMEHIMEEKKVTSREQIHSYFNPLTN